MRKVGLKMPKLLMLKGLPASGKSTYAKDLLDREPGLWKRVNKDDLRALLDNGKWSKKNEQFVLTVRDGLIISALDLGYNVVVDDTNFSPTHKVNFQKIAADNGAVFEEKYFEVPLNECIERDSKRANPVGQKVIMDMFDKYLKPEVEEDPNLPDCVLCDLDGTLALFDGNPYDRDFSKDVPNKAVLAALLPLCGDYHNQVELIITSGRSGKYRDVTVKWLRDNSIPVRQLLMRDEGDSRKDRIVKKEIYDTRIKELYNVLFVFDDRDQVVSLWRELGLTCFQVNYGDF